MAISQPKQTNHFGVKHVPSQSIPIKTVSKLLNM